MSYTFLIILFLPLIMSSFSSFQIVSMLLFRSTLLFVFLLKTVTLTGPNIFTSTSWQVYAFLLSPSKSRPRLVIFVLHDIIQFIKSSICFSFHQKFFLDFLLVKVAFVTCSWAILNSLIFFCTCVVETKLSRPAGKMHSYEKIFSRLTKISLSLRRDLG